MLSKIEIDAYWYKINKHILNRNEIPIDISDTTKYSSILVSDNRVVGIAKHPLSAKSLATFDKQFWFGFYTEKMQSLPQLVVKRSECWKLKLNESDDAWVENYQIYSIDELKDIILTNQKIYVMDIMNNKIESYRSNVTKHLNSQDFVHTAKYLEAKEILEKNITEDILLKYPFTTGYASLKGIDLQESARRIIIQYEIQCSYLAESENVRMKYKEKLLNEKNIENLRNLLNDFMTEHHKYGQSL